MTTEDRGLRPGAAVEGAAAQLVPVRDDGDIAAAILALGRLADQVGLAPTARASLLTAASELATNILKYAGRGMLKIRVVDSRQQRGVEVIAEDHGPGIADLRQAMQDHYSAAGTLGLGLPGARRLMDEFHLWSEPGRGTRVTVRKWKA